MRNALAALACVSLLVFNQHSSPVEQRPAHDQLVRFVPRKQIIEDAAAGRRHMTRAVFITQHILGFRDLTCIELNRMIAPSKAFSVPAKTNRNFSSG